jgi:hypothetical protein
MAVDFTTIKRFLDEHPETDEARPDILFRAQRVQDARGQIANCNIAFVLGQYEDQFCQEFGMFMTNSNPQPRKEYIW